MADELPEREARMYQAFLAEQCERYDEMVEHMRAACLSGPELNAKERNYLAVAYKQAVGQRRAAWRIVSAMEQGEIEKGNHMTTADATAYRKEIEREMQTLCHSVLDLLTKELLPKATTAEAQVTFFKSLGDFHRYLAEITDGKEKTDETRSAKEAYEKGTRIAEESLKVTDAVRLGLALNHAVFLYEVMRSPTESVRVGRKAYEDSVREIDNMGEETIKDSILVMQLIRDNLTLWTADPND